MKDTKLTMVKGDTLAFGVEIEGLDQDLATAYFSCNDLRRFVKLERIPGGRLDKWILENV